MIPMMTPNRPSADPKISTIKILTKVDGVCASARAHPEPVTPTHTPQNRLDKPTERPEPNSAKPLNKESSWFYISSDMLFALV